MTSSKTLKVPVEVWTRLRDFFTSPADVVNLASISPQALSSVADSARCPWVLEFRLWFRIIPQERAKLVDLLLEHGADRSSDGSTPSALARNVGINKSYMSLPGMVLILVLTTMRIGCMILGYCNLIPRPYHHHLVR